MSFPLSACRRITQKLRNKFKYRELTIQYYPKVINPVDQTLYFKIFYKQFTDTRSTQAQNKHMWNTETVTTMRWQRNNYTNRVVTHFYFNPFCLHKPLDKNRIESIGQSICLIIHIYNLKEGSIVLILYKKFKKMKKNIRRSLRNERNKKHCTLNMNEMFRTKPTGNMIHGIKITSR